MFQRSWLFLLIPLLLFVALPAHAQFDTGQGVSLIISPANPKPYDTITVTPNSTSIDLISANVSISVAGKVVEQGSGIQSVPVTLGAPGTATTISVSAKSGGQTYTSSVTIHPADVALVVEPSTSTHPFYLGAPLVAPQGTVRLVAIADLRTTPSVRINPANLIYTWKLGDQILQSSSGMGRSVLPAVAPVKYRDADITVTVTNQDGTIVAESATTISPVDPVIRIYHNDVLMGPDFNNALSGTYVMNSQEDAFRGVAYYFGTTPSLAWSLNGQTASNAADVTVRTTSSGEGNASLSFAAKTGDFSQSGKSALTVSFGGKKSTNIFGF